jgi:hypothetical protein
VPEDVSEETLNQSDALQEQLHRLRAAEYALREVIFQPFPPDPRTNVTDSALLLAVIPQSDVTTIPVVLDLQGNGLAAAAIDDAGSTAMLRAIVTGTAPDQLLIAAIPTGLRGDKLASVVAQRLQAAKESATDWTTVEAALANAVADETRVTTLALPSGTLVDAARADVGKLTELVDELTETHRQAGRS